MKHKHLLFFVVLLLAFTLTGYFVGRELLKSNDAYGQCTQEMKDVFPFVFLPIGLTLSSVITTLFVSTVKKA